MKRLVLFAATLCALVVATSPASAILGAMCFSDANCGYGEICVKMHDYDPYGQCIKGAR